MLNLNLQFFAHKKGVGSTKNVCVSVSLCFCVKIFVC